MLKKIFIFIIICISVLTFPYGLKDIYELSKLPDTINKSWSDFLAYVSQNPGDEEINKYGELISAKRNFYEKYKNFKFAGYILSEDFGQFLTSLGIMSVTYHVPEEDTKNLLIIFSDDIQNLKNSISSGNIDQISYFKHIYRLTGIEDYIIPENPQAFFVSVMDKALNMPSYFDFEIENFMENFMGKSYYKIFDYVIEESKIYLNEKDYIGGFKLLNFLDGKNSLSVTNKNTYMSLKDYFELKNTLSEKNSGVYFLEDSQIDSFAAGVIDNVQSFEKITLEKDSLKQLIISLLKTLNTRIEKLGRKIILSDNKIDEILENMKDEDIQPELMKLKLSTRTRNDIPVNITENSTETVTENTLNFTGYIKYLIGVLIVLLIILLPEIFPSEKTVEILCKLNMGKYAVRTAEKLVLKKPKDYISYIALARAYETIGEYTSAVTSYKNAAKMKKDSGRTDDV